MSKRVIRKAFDRERQQLEFEKDGKLIYPSIVEQHHTEDTLVQNILKKYDQTGVFYHVNQAQATYQDNTAFNEYQDMYDKIQSADANFKALPSEIREKFNNDTGKFLEFVNDDNNIEAMYDLGLMQKPIPPVEVVQPAETAAQEAEKTEE